jgi:hypothetical protein
MGMDDGEVETNVADGQIKSAIQASTTLDEKIAKVRHRKFKQVVLDEHYAAQ